MARNTRLSLESLEARNLMAYDAFLTLDGIPGESKMTAEVEVGDPTGVPAIDDFKSGEDNALIGLLVPAVQKVREAAARMNCVEVEIDLPLTDGQGEDGILIGLLLPAVQKVREAALQGDEQLPISNGEEDGLLLPAVQKVREAGAVDETYLEIKLEDILISSITDGTSEESYYKVTLKDVLVSSYQSGGHEGSFPTDQFELDLDFVNDDAEAYLTYTLEDCMISG